MYIYLTSHLPPPEGIYHALYYTLHHLRQAPPPQISHPPFRQPNQNPGSISISSSGNSPSGNSPSGDGSAR